MINKSEIKPRKNKKHRKPKKNNKPKVYYVLILYTIECQVG